MNSTFWGLSWPTKYVAQIFINPSQRYFSAACRVSRAVITDRSSTVSPYRKLEKRVKNWFRCRPSAPITWSDSWKLFRQHLDRKFDLELTLSDWAAALSHRWTIIDDVVGFHELVCTARRTLLERPHSCWKESIFLLVFASPSLNQHGRWRRHRLLIQPTHFLNPSAFCNAPQICSTFVNYKGRLKFMWDQLLCFTEATLLH